MGQAYFYHLTDSPLAQALPILIERARAAGWRVAVRGPDAETVAQLDSTLWGGAEDGFLAHGLAGGAHDGLQPVLLCAADQAVTNGAACLMTVGGAEVAAADISAFERVCVMFDGLDGAAVAVARTQWKAVTEAGHAALYWAQEDGRWTKKTESAASA